MTKSAGRLRVVRQEHDYGTYLELVVEYDGNDEWAARYAARCDAEAPTTWAQAGMTAPATRGRSRA